jgi:hypothetical protein
LAFAGDGAGFDDITSHASYVINLYNVRNLVMFCDDGIQFLYCLAQWSVAYYFCRRDIVSMARMRQGYFAFTRNTEDCFVCIVEI